MQNVNQTESKGKSSEVMVMEYLNEKLKDKRMKGFPTLIASGFTPSGHEFIAMESLGINLKMMQKQISKFSLRTVIQIGIQLTQRLQTLHEIGYLHLDLKPDNICLGSTNLGAEESSILCLIDFGISKPYLNEYNLHIEPGTNIIFQGNILYASENAFRQKVLSRRDDFISLTYILSSFLNGKLEWMQDLRRNDPDFFRKVGKIKKNLTIKQICCDRA